MQGITQLSKDFEEWIWFKDGGNTNNLWGPVGVYQRRANDANIQSVNYKDPFGWKCLTGWRILRMCKFGIANSSRKYGESRCQTYIFKFIITFAIMQLGTWQTSQQRHFEGKCSFEIMLYFFIIGLMKRSLKHFIGFMSPHPTERLEELKDRLLFILHNNN